VATSGGGVVGGDESIEELDDTDVAENERTRDGAFEGLLGVRCEERSDGVYSAGDNGTIAGSSYRPCWSRCWTGDASGGCWGAAN